MELAAAETAAMSSNQIFNQVPLPFLHRVIRFDVHISEERIYWVEDSAPQVRFTVKLRKYEILMYLRLVVKVSIRLEIFPSHSARLENSSLGRK